MIKKYIDLNESYDNGELRYWCNNAGDLFNPETQKDCGLNDLPPKIKNLYLNYWGEIYNSSTFVATYNGNPMIIFNYLFDESYIDDLLEQLNENPFSTKMDRVWLAIQDVANMLVDKTPGCFVFAGTYTDPDGHEILVGVPYCMRDKLEEIDKLLDQFVYSTFEELF